MSNHKPRGFYFEEFIVGQTIHTAGRTVTETDIVSFAGLSGDFNSIHIDAAYAETQFFKQRVAHGLLRTSIASGLAVQTGFMEGTILAFRGMTEWKFSKPISSAIRFTSLSKCWSWKPMPRLGGGLITISSTCRIKKGETVQSGKWEAIMVSKPKDNEQ